MTRPATPPSEAAARTHAASPSLMVVGHPRAATSTAIASAGTIAAPTHATGDAAGASRSDGIRPS